MTGGIRDLKFDPDNWEYILIENQDLATVEDLEAIKQHVRQRLQFFKNEYKHDLTRGIPYHDDFFKKNPNPVIMDAILKNVILTTPGIIELLSFSMIEDSTLRLLTVTFKADTDYGILEYSNEVPLG